MSEHEKTFDIIFGRWRSQILYAGVKLGEFDCVNSVPKNASEIARRLDPLMKEQFSSLNTWFQDQKNRTFPSFLIYI